MRIAMIVPGGLHPSGREQVVPSWLALFEWLSRSHDVHAFVFKHLPTPSTYTLRGFTVHDLGRPTAPLGLALRAQERAIRAAIEHAGRFDVVHGFFGDPAGIIAARTGRLLDVPSVVTLDSGEFTSVPDIEYGSQRTARGSTRISEACGLATRTHVCSQFMAAAARSNGVNAVVIPLASDLSSATLTNTAPVSGRQQLIQIATLSLVKNQSALLEALPRILQHADVHLDLVGEDTLGGRLQARARATEVADRVTFHGFVPQDTLPPLLANANLYVQTSLHEAAGVSMLEAAAAGVPAIGSRVGYLADWAPQQAVAVDDLSPAGLAQAILDLLCDRSRRERIGRSAQEWVRANTAEAAARQFEVLYKQLAARGNRRD